MLGGHGRALEIAAGLLDASTRQRCQPLPALQIDGTSRLQARRGQPGAMERHRAPRMGKQPGELMELVFEKLLGGPPLAILETLLVGEHAGTRRRESGAVGSDRTACHL